MAREYAQFPTALLREQEFRELTAGQQHTFFMLCLRQEHGALGVLTDLFGRFSYPTADLDAASMLEHARRLALNGWLVLDEGVGELFIPRFMEFNNVAKNPNRLRAAISEADSIESVIIRAAAAEVLSHSQRIDAQRAATRLKADQADGARPRSRRNISAAVRLAVYERDGWRCVYCDRPFEPVANGAPEDQEAAVWLELDHINPYSRGGVAAAENLRAACSTCNRRRGVDDLDLWAEKIGDA